MIYKSLLENELIDGIVQDPNEPGVDLDAVEKAVAGEDGIAAHQDEVEAATDGMIGEPVDEFAMIIYESEYNYNQIMEAIGMNELRESAMGRDLVLEAADIKGFFKTVKNFFVQMFERITKAVRDILAKLDLQAKSDKKFVAENKTYIIEGAKADWNMKGYNIGDLSKFYEGAGKADADVAIVKKAIETLKTVDSSKLHEEIKEVQAKSKDVEKEIINQYGAGVAGENLKAFRKNLHNEIFGEKVELKGKIDAQAVIDVLSNERESSKIRATYNDIKKAFAATIADIKAWEATAAKAEDKNLYVAAAQCAIKLCKSCRAVSNTAYSVAISAAKYKRALYRKLAHEFAKAGQSKGKYKPKQEGASIFDGINIL